MSTTTNEVILQLTFTDSTTRNYTIPEVPTENLTNVKTRVQTINSNLENNMDTDFAQTFVSSSGAYVSRITAARAVKTTEEVIYNG